MGGFPLASKPVTEFTDEVFM